MDPCHVMLTKGSFVCTGVRQELENKITQIEKHEAERREQEERKHKEEAPAGLSTWIFAPSLNVRLRA